MDGEKDILEPVESGQNPADWLRAEYARRRAKNPYYSLRAFARHLQIPSGPLSEILVRKRPLSKKMAAKIAARLGFTVFETELFVNPATAKKLRYKDASKTYQQISSDRFSVIADWYHFGLLSLMRTQDFKNEVPWIAKRLGISNTEVRSAMERLFRLGLIRKKGRSFEPTGNLATTQDVPSSAGRQYLNQGLQQAASALENTPIELRDITSITMAIDPAKLPIAKKLIQQFRHNLAELLEEEPSSEVYKLNVQLFPMTKRGTT